MKRLTHPSILALTLILAACGGGGSSEAPEAAATASNGAQMASSAVVTSSEADTTRMSTTTSVASSAQAAEASASQPASAPATSATPAPAPVAASPAPTTTTGTAASPAPAPVATPGAPAVIEYYGDSTVWGYRTNTGGQVAKPAPTAFAEALPNPSAWVVRNEGVSGTTACELLNGTDGRHQPWAKQMAASSARYVFVNHAINDEWKYDVNTYKSCLRSLAQTAKQYGKQMIFETPNPTRDSGSWGLDVYVNAMKEVASQESVPVVDQYKYLTDYLNGSSPYTICPDGLHPTDAVYVMKGKYAAGVFSSLFIK